MKVDEVKISRPIAVGIALVAAAAIAIAVARTTGDEASVLGTKLGRCKTVDGPLTVAPGVHRLTAENTPLRVTVSGGRITSVLAPAVKIEPGAETPTPVASFTLGRPRTIRGTLDFEVRLENLTACRLDLSLGRASATRGGAKAVESPIRFGGTDRAQVSPGQGMGWNVSIPLDGDGTYQITATVEAEFGLVR